MKIRSQVCKSCRTRGCHKLCFSARLKEERRKSQEKHQSRAKGLKVTEKSTCEGESGEFPSAICLDIDGDLFPELQYVVFEDAETTRRVNIDIIVNNISLLQMISRVSRSSKTSKNEYKTIGSSKGTCRTSRALQFAVKSSRHNSRL